jgi:hypothetical protein
MYRDLFMDDHDTYTLTSVTIISLGYFSIHLDSSFTAENVLTRMVTPSRVWSRIILYSRF